MTQGTIFDIKRFAINDGPGIRTTVFFKGCPLACYWCHNPESQRIEPQIAYYASKCIHCGQCINACPRGAISAEEVRVVIDRAKCRGCGTCAQTCPSEALAIIGRCVTVEELLPELVADREFYIVSGGGITLSGGEPLLQPAFAAELVAACRAHGLDVVLDTSGYSSWEHLKTLATQCSLVLYDVKSLDADRHLAGTGKPLDTVLCNLMSLVQLIGPDRTILRCPLVPGFNNRPQDFQALSHLAAKLGTAVEILPFHRLGTAKYEVLGQPIPSNLPDAQMAAAEATNLCHELRARGIACRVT